MKNIFIIIVLAFCIHSVKSQSFVNRSNPQVTAADARLKATLNFYLPVGMDTTLNGGIDSVGALFFRWADTSVYVRTPRLAGAGNMWALLFKLNSSPSTAGVVSFNGRNGVVTLISSDVISALGYTAANAATSLNINGVAQDISINRNWTVGNVRTDGSYANPSWITSLDYSKLTGVPPATGISNLGGLTAATQTFANGSSGTTPNWSSVGSTHTLNIPLASTSGVIGGLIPNSFYTQLVTLTGSQVLTNKTLTSPFINFGTNANGDIMVRIAGNYTRLAPGTNGQTLTISGGIPSWQTPASPGTGTVTSFSSGALSPLFTTNVNTATTTPALSFSLSNTSQYSVFGRSASGTGAPSYVNLTSAFISDFVNSVRNSISLTTLGTAGAATYNPVTGILNIPNYTGGGGGGDGTVTYVDLTLPASVFNVSGGPITTSGTFNGTFANQSAYTVFARGASTGVPSFQSLNSTFISDFNTASRNSISMTTLGISGAATYNSTTGVINVPQYASSAGYAGNYD